MIQNKQLLIFDCDGVLFDSAGANIAYFNLCLERLNLPPLSETMKSRAVFLSVHQLFLEILGDPVKADEAFIVSQNLPYDDFLPMLEPLFDFHRVFSHLRSRYFLALASNRSKSLVKVMKHYKLFDYFHFKISALDARPKPAPDMLISCLEYFDISPEYSLFIGDSESDSQAAHNAAIEYLHVGRHDRCACINSVEELLSHC